MDGNEILQAATGQSFGSMMLHSRLDIVRANIVRAYGLRGLGVPDAVELESITREVESKIGRSYRHMTAAELAMVMEAGVSGELGKDVRITCASIFGWISAYMSSDQRKEVLRTTMRRRSPQKDMLPAEQVESLNAAAQLRGARVLWEEYKANGSLAPEHLDGYIEMVCDGLMRRGVISPNKAAWAEAEKKARAEERRVTNGRSLSDCLKARKVKKYILLMYFRELQSGMRELPELR